MGRKPYEKLDDLMQEGYAVMYGLRQPVVGCKVWLKAWDMIKQMATPEMRSTEDFDEAYPLTQYVFNWFTDMEMALHNAGLSDKRYHEHRVRFVREFITQFPGEADDDHNYVNFRRAEAEGLWNLGRQEEAETVFRALVEKLPDEGWAYIGWSDQYYIWRDSAKDYQSGEAILLQALAQPGLKDRDDVLERLVDLYEEWDKPEKQAPFLAELETSLGHQVTPRKLKPVPDTNKSGVSLLSKLGRLFGGGTKPKLVEPKKSKKLKRNDPCWCGSGRKYKHCHMKK